MKEIKAFECDHCRKVYKTAHGVKNHEEWCDMNPKNKKACMDCVHCQMTHQDYYHDNYDGSETKTVVRALFCKKIDSFLLPLKAQRRGNAYDFPDHPNIPMLKNCEHQRTHQECAEEEFNVSDF